MLPVSQFRLPGRVSVGAWPGTGDGIDAVVRVDEFLGLTGGDWIAVGVAQWVTARRYLGGPGEMT